ncbi:hypothetical protein [Peterkaempfera sp. SMS 1(5)a]|uniref:hypothetical protein n=1 Tax=Peterkaempfera podocarpi TaxID=3232308 RepID=UPI0036724FB7
MSRPALAALLLPVVLAAVVCITQAPPAAPPDGSSDWAEAPPAPLPRTAAVSDTPAPHRRPLRLPHSAGPARTTPEHSHVAPARRSAAPEVRRSRLHHRHQANRRLPATPAHGIRAGIMCTLGARTGQLPRELLTLCRRLYGK